MLMSEVDERSLVTTYGRLFLREGQFLRPIVAESGTVLLSRNIWSTNVERAITTVFKSATSFVPSPWYRKIL